MEARVGDRVSIDAKKVGQPRRSGVIRNVAKGLSGTRYQVRWDDGHESVIAPGAGNLTIEGKAGGNSKRSSNSKRKPARRGTTARARSSKRRR